MERTRGPLWIQQQHSESDAGQQDGQALRHRRTLSDRDGNGISKTYIESLHLIRTLSGHV